MSLASVLLPHPTADDGGQGARRGVKRDVVEQGFVVVDGRHHAVHTQAPGASGSRSVAATHRGAAGEHQVHVADGDRHQFGAAAPHPPGHR